MARFDTSGIDEIIKDMEDLGEDIGEAADEMLLAGAEVVKEEWRKSANKHGLKDTGAMIESIGFSKKPKSVSGIKQIDIYPQGKDAKGVRNAEKAFVNNYGTSNPNYTATHFADEADAASEEPVQRVFEEGYEKLLKKKGMIK